MCQSVIGLLHFGDVTSHLLFPGQLGLCFQGRLPQMVIFACDTAPGNKSISLIRVTFCLVKKHVRLFIFTYLSCCYHSRQIDVPLPNVLAVVNQPPLTTSGRTCHFDPLCMISVDKKMTEIDVASIRRKLSKEDSLTCKNKIFMYRVPIRYNKK